MSRRAQWSAIAVVAAVAGGALVVALNSSDDGFVMVTAGMPAPQFTAYTVDENRTSITLDNYRGKVVVLNIWATWCAPCRKEMPSFQRLQDSYLDGDVRIVAVSVDAPGMEGPIRDFVTDLGLSFDILYDPQGTIQRDYTTAGVPETFVIGRDGVIALKHIGPAEWDNGDLRNTIDSLARLPGER